MSVSADALQVLYSALVAISLIGYATAIGWIALAPLASDRLLAVTPFRLGASFSLGIATTLIALRLVAYVPAGLTPGAIAIVLGAVAGIIFVTSRKSLSPLRVRPSFRWAMIVGALFVAVLGVQLLVWLHVFPDLPSMYWHLGTGHPGRYLTIAHHFYSESRAGNVGQHFASSLFAAIVFSFGGFAGNVIFSIVMAATTVSLMLMIFGLFGYWGLGLPIAGAMTFAVMVGNAGPTLTPLWMVDTGWPLLIGGIPDAQLALGVALLLVCLATFVDRLNHAQGVLIFLCGAFLFFSMESIAALACSLAVAGLVGSAFLHGAISPTTRYVCILVVLSALPGIVLGGVLTPSFLLEGASLPGALKGLQSATLSLHLFYPFQVIAGSIFDPTSWHQFFFEPQLLAKDKIPSLLTYEGSWYLESQLFAVLRTNLFAIAGPLILLGYAARDDHRLRLFSAAALLVWFAGFAVAVSLSFPTKWEVSRFMAPGLLLGASCWWTAMGYLTAKRQLNPAIVWIAVAFTTIGPTMRYINAVAYNIMNFDRWQIYFSTS